MSATRDILRSWRAPRQVVRGLMAGGYREERSLAFLMLGCLVVFVAQWPRLVRLAMGHDPSAGAVPPLYGLVSYEFLAWLIFWPLMFYLLAAAVFLLLRLFCRAVHGYGVRLALFWGLLASTPAALLYGLVRGFIGPGVAADITGALWIGGFAVIVGAGLRVAVRPPQGEQI